MNRKAWFVVAASVLLAGGLALGAHSQKETFLHPDKLQGSNAQEAAGNLVTLTALLPALGIAIGAASISRAQWHLRILPAVVAFVTVFGLVWIVQSAWPNYDAVQELKQASFTITPLISNGSAVGAILLAPLALFLGLGLGLQWALTQLVRTRRRESATRRFTGAFLLATPFLAVAAAGDLHLLLSLPNGEAETTAYMFVFPVAVLAALGLIVVGAIKLWHVGTFEANNLLADSSREAWLVLRRVEWVLMGALAALAVLSSALPAIAGDQLESGRTFGVTTRGYMQAHLLLLIPLIPWLAADKPIEQRMVHGHTISDKIRIPLGVPLAWVAALVAVALAGLTTWFAAGALWPWLVALAPCAFLAWMLRCEGQVWLSAVLGVVLWGIGNTIEGQFALRENTALSLQVAPGLLALFRFLAVTSLAVGLAIVARANAGHLRRAAAWPMAIGIGTCVGLVALMELPLTAWIAPTADGEFVGIGSVIASHDPSVRWTFHIIAAGLALVAGMLAARLHRPDWFRRRGPLPTLTLDSAAT